MALVVLTIGAVQEGHGEPYIPKSALVWVVKHQRPDGSWGSLKGGCECFGRWVEPKPVTKDPEVAKRAKPLLDLLRTGALSERDRASADLLKMRETVEPFLSEAAQDPDPEFRVRVRSLLDTIRAGRDQGDLEATALALLVLSGAGYSHQSKDRLDGVCPGEAISKGIQWLVDRQRADGGIGEGRDLRPEQAMAALALSQVYGTSGSRCYQEPAAAACGWVVGLQGKNGSCNDEVELTCWCLLVLVSADATGEDREGFRGHADRIARAAAWLRDRPKKEGALELAASVLAVRCVEGGQDAGVLGKLAASKAADLNPRTRFQVTFALYKADGPVGTHWSKWFERINGTATSHPRPCRQEGGAGAGFGTRTLFDLFAFEVAYGYANVPYPKK